MPQLMRSRTSRDDGVAALLVAFMFGATVFITMLALVIDIGIARLERRQLQNGAEAASVQAAFDCSLNGSGGHVCGNRTPAITIASRNASDNAADIIDGALCGPTVPGRPCDSATQSTLNCPTTPSGNQWVQVTTSTLTAGGSKYLPQFFSRTLPGFGERTITACSQAMWGAPGRMDLSVPFAIGQTCWQQQLAAHANAMPTSPPYTGMGSGANPEPWSSYESTFVFGKDTVGPTGSCTLTAVSPGGFGWLDASADMCNITLDYGQSSSDTGKSQSSTPCSNKMFGELNATLSGNTTTPAFFNRVSYVPIFDTMTGTTGTNASYHVSGFAAFYMTGFQAPALSKKVDSRHKINDSKWNDCASNLACVYGWFVNTTIIAPNSVPAGAGQTTYGLNVVNLVG